MSKIFISYRRDDSADIAGRIYDYLTPPLGPFQRDDVFKDVDTIPLGVNFKTHLESAVAQCAVQLVVIGPRWLTVTNETGQRRLDDPEDFVRIEVEAALQRGIPVIPLLVMGATIPSEKDLPLALGELPYKNATLVRRDPDFHNDMKRVVGALEDLLKSAEQVTQRRRGTFPVWLIAPFIFFILAGIIVFMLGHNNSFIASNATMTSPPTAAPTVATPSLISPTTFSSTALPAGTARHDGIGIAQVWIPGGCFMMGSTEQQIQDALDTATKFDKYAQIIPYWPEKPQHKVCLAHGYWIDQFDVTNAEFDAFVKAGGYTADSNWSPNGLSWVRSNNFTGPGTSCTLQSNTPQQPRTCINWYEAEAYANWRTKTLNDGVYYRLPTEAEWEYAARGPSSLIYPWGNIFDGGKLNYCDKSCPEGYSDQSVNDGYAFTSPVGQYEGGKSWANAYDMAGNVWQWTADWFDENYYQNSPLYDPTGPGNGDGRVRRGGSWDESAADVRSSFRSSYSPFRRANTNGFRLIGFVPPS